LIYTRVAIRKLKQVHDNTHPARLDRQNEDENGTDKTNDDTPNAGLS